MNKYVTNYHFYTNYRNINSISQHLNDTTLNSYFNHCYKLKKKKKKKKNIEKQNTKKKTKKKTTKTKQQQQKKKKKKKRMSGTSTFDSCFCIISTLEYHMLERSY